MHYQFYKITPVVDNNDDDEDKARLSGSYQVSGWAVNGRELAGTPTHPPFFSDQHCVGRDDIDDHHLRMR